MSTLNIQDIEDANDPILYKIGYPTEEELKNHLTVICITGNGIEQYYNFRTWIFRKLTMEKEYPRLEKREFPEGKLFEMINFKKIPIALLYNTVQFYYEIMKKMKTEVYSFICWNKKEKKYEIKIPKQTVSAASVDFEYSEDENIIRVIEAHSHHTMAAHFSGTDNENNVVPCIHIVIGSLKGLYDYDLKIRISYGDKDDYTDLDKNDILNIFDIPQSYIDDITMNKWLENIEEKKYPQFNKSDYDVWAEKYYNQDRKLNNYNYNEKNEDFNYNYNNDYDNNSFWNNDKNKKDKIIIDPPNQGEFCHKRRNIYD